MIDTDLLDLINSGNAWILVGSGVSVDAGLPSWANLVGLTLAGLDSEQQQKIRADSRFNRAREAKNYGQCFQRMQEIASHGSVAAAVAELVFRESNRPGYLTRLLVDWPAAGFLTTNYDNLLELALEESGARGWIPVGNRADEVKKVSGDVQNIVWHIHGSAHLPESASKLILGSVDYDDLYLEDSPLQQQLKAFFTQRRLLFVGFGLRDPHIMRLLRLAGRYTVPERPIYAFLGSRAPEEDENEIQELREHYNIEVKPYRVVEDAHRELIELLDVYSSMVVRRSVTYGQHPASVPSYDPDTTGLLIYNTLVLQNPHGLHGETLRPMLSARVLSVAEHRDTVTLDDLSSDVGRIAFRLAGETRASEELDSIVEELQQRELVTLGSQGQETTISLTPAGHSFVAERAGVAQRIREQFWASLLARAGEQAGGNSDFAEEIAVAAMHFLEECIEKRALGVAMALNAPDSRSQEFQVVALLQALPKFFGQLSNPYSARGLVKLVQELLSAPTEAEAKHCGLLLQARLGVHLLGVDSSALESRMQALANMAFVLDSTSLIPLLAVSGTGHSAAVELLKRIERIGAKAITTQNLVTEVSEHASYATRVVRDGNGPTNSGALKNLMGQEGQRTNVFLSGFAAECASGAVISNGFDLYMRQTCGFGSIPATNEDCNRLIRKYGVVGVSVSDVPGFAQEDYVEIEELKAQIEERRRLSSTYRHDRQVLAEAEVVVLVQKLRDKAYSFDGHTFQGVFFVSNSRFIDQLNSTGLPITMRQNVLLQWLGTVAPFEESELPVLMDGLLWELSERGIDFVDRKKLRTAFSGIISAAREEYPRVVEQHKILIATEWGVDPSAAFQEPYDDLNLSSLVPRHAQQTIDRQQRELERIKVSTAKSQAEQQLSRSERSQFERLKAAKELRVQKNRRKSRARASNSRSRGNARR